MSATQSTDNHLESNNGEGKERRDDTPSPARKTSMGTLITWNISKALESSPHLDLRSAIEAAQARLERSRELSAVLTQPAAERHVACAVLAWQQLGHRGADSLYRFVALHMKEKQDNLRKAVETSESGFSSEVGSVAPVSRMAAQDSAARRWPAACKGPEGMAPEDKGLVGKGSLLAASAGPGPVLRLPAEPVVMRLDAGKPGNAGPPGKPGKPPPCRPVCRKMPDVNGQIESACCLDSSCSEKLQAVDKATQELRARAARLAQREADRVALLERAEAAWRDLEAGYERRLRLAEEKETEIESRVAKLINERNDFKRTCSAMVEGLTGRTDAAEKQRAELLALEKEVCALACERATHAEQVARGNQALAEELCRTAQLDRELLLKEEQARRKQMTMESEAEAAQAMTHEAERALAGELCALKGQMEQVARELLLEDELASGLKAKLASVRQERDGLTQDLETCTQRCDGGMKGMLDELKAKREELAALKLKVLDCNCKLPVDASVEVKRTPSLAALCLCSPEERLVDSCSCTSLRTRLMSNLLSDLFSGLQSEMNLQDTLMPCQFLKCLEDKHNWDRSSAVKTRLREFFSKLLLGELDIAIATSIEKYHAKWVGESCADTVARLRPPPNCMHTQGWQERALELKAQKMATELAEQLFKNKAKELAKEAKSILAETGRPPCECHPETCCPSSHNMYPCLIGPPKITTHSLALQAGSKSPPRTMCRTLNDVTKLKREIEDLKKDIIKREDLYLMEQKIAKMVQLASATSPTISMQDSLSPTGPYNRKDIKTIKPITTTTTPLFRNNRCTGKSPINNKKKLSDSAPSPNKSNRTNGNPCGVNNCNKYSRRPTQHYAINLCLLDPKKKSAPSKDFQQLPNPPALSFKHSPSGDNGASIRQSKPVALALQECTNVEDLKLTSNCVQNCICFHKKPSNTSIDKLLETLAKWKMDLVESPEKLNVDEIQDTESLVKTSQKSSSYTRNFRVIDDKNLTKEEKTDLKISNKNMIPIHENEPCNRTNFNNADMITELPVPTESEYMGAINLEKSTDNSCKCEYNENVKNPINNGYMKFPFKCIYSTKCVCKDCTSVPIHHEQGLDAQSFLFKNFIPVESKTHHDDRKTAELYTENFTNTEMGDVIKSSYNVLCPESLLPNQDNHIKCLGVTLTNINPNKKNKKRYKRYVENMPFVQNTLPGSKKEVKLDNTRLKTKNPRKNHISLEEDHNDKNYLLNEDHFYYYKSEPDKDQGLNINKSREMKDEPCICCNNYDAGDDSKDLEANTFQLLEEHLKGKLEEFKQSFCVPNVEEEKIFTAILERIKQLISESTGSMACKCVGTKHVNGSWNRAYILLQEYLRAKIDRVKCQCDSDKMKNKNEKVLPNVLENISHLIENDFKRLKEICKCKEVISFEVETKEKNQVELKSILLSGTNRKIREPLDFEHDHVPTSDRRADSDYLQNRTEHILKDFKIPAFFTNSISAQVSLYPFMETRSCDAMRKDSHFTEVQTIDNIGGNLFIDGYNNARSACDCRSKEKFEKQQAGASIQQSELSIFPISAPTSNSNVEKAGLEEAYIDKNSVDTKNSSRKSSVPYIGYTMNCTCDKDLGCVCTKSTVTAVNDRLKIKDIWKKNTTKRVVFPELSYMLDVDGNKPCTIPKTMNCNTVTGDFFVDSVTETNPVNISEKNVRDSEISAIDENGILLKKSKEKIKFCHEMTNTVKKYRSSISENKIGGSLKRSDIVISPGRRKSDHISILKQNKVDDTYSSNNILHKHFNSNQAINDNLLSCDCKKIPLCHVKMLVANIEDKLANAQCTCDSLIAKVCPVHSTTASN